MPKRLPDDAKHFRPVAEGLKRAEGLTRAKTAPVDPSLVRAVMAESHTTARTADAAAPPPPPTATTAAATPAVAARTAEADAPPSDARFVVLPGRDDRRDERVEAPERPRTHEPKLERSTVQLRFKATESERVEITQLINRHAQALGTPVTFSHVMRAWMNILRHSEAELLRGLQKTKLKRPANEDALALADFERALSDVYLEALKKAPRITSGRME